MIAQIRRIDFLLIRLATVATAAVGANYLLWSIAAPAWMRHATIVVLLVSIGWFVLKKRAYLPAVIFVTACFCISLGSPIPGSDASVIWLFHAKRILIDNNLYATLDGYAPWSHNDYPLLVPAMAASLSDFFGVWNKVLPKLANTLVFFPAFLVLLSVLHDRKQQLVLCVGILAIIGRYLINGYMDGILALYATATSLLVYSLCLPSTDSGFTTAERRWLYALAGLLLAALPLIKNEGLVLLGICMAAAVGLGIWLKTKRASFVLVVVGIFALLPTLAWKWLCVHHAIPSDFSNINFLVHLTSLKGLGALLQSFFLSLNMLMLAALLLYLFRASTDRVALWFVAFVALAYLSVLFIVYASTPYDPDWHLRTSIRRTTMPILFLLVFYAIALYPGKRPAATNASP